MYCLNCHYEDVPPDSELCPRCKIHLPSLLRDVLAPGTLLRSDTYRLDYALGRGSFGITYSAHHTVLDEVFAIKEFYPIEFALRNQLNQSVIVPSQATHSYQRALYRFMEEARILAKLNHPNVVRVYDIFEDHDTAYMVMNLIQGKTLTQVIKAHPGRKLPLPKVESLIEQMVAALTAIHQSGIFHLDLKPENIILSADSQAHLIDFGAARQAANAKRMETRLFTEQYAAPEIITGGELGPESDLFELGMMVHQLLTGKLPPEAMKRLSEGDDWRPEGLIPPWDHLVSSALQLKRSDRPRSVQEWWDTGSHSVNRRFTAAVPKNHTADTFTGQFLLPDLWQEKMQQRLGRGVIRSVRALSSTLTIAIAAGGATLFNLETGKALWEIDNPIEQGLWIAEEQLLIFTYRRWVYVWDMSKGKLLQQFYGHDQNIISISCSTKGRLVCCGYKSDVIKIWDARSGQEYPAFHKIANRFTQVAVSQEGRYLAVGNQEGIVCLWDVDKGLEISSLEGHQLPITSLAFSPNGDILASGSQDNQIMLWSIPSGQAIKRIKGHLDWITGLVFSSDNCLLASIAGIDDKSIRVWDLNTYKEIKRFQGHWNRVQSLDFCPNNDYLISGGYDDTIRLWNIEEGIETKQIKRHSNWIYSVACSPNGQWIATASNDQSIQIWNRLERRKANTLIGHRDRVTSLVFSPDGRFLLSGSWDHTLRLWDVSFGNVIRAFPGHHDWITSVAISSNHQYIASAGWECTVRLWDVALGWQMLRSREPRRILQGHSQPITSIAFSPDNRLIATASQDKTLRVWEVDSGQEIYCCLGHRHHICCVTFSPDGQFIASGSSDKTVRLWHVASGKEMKPAFQHDDSVRAIAYSGGGNWLATGSTNGTIRLWNLLTGQEEKQLQGHTNRINALTFYEQLLIAGDQDGVVRCWQI